MKDIFCLQYVIYMCDDSLNIYDFLLLLYISLYDFPQIYAGYQKCVIEDETNYNTAMSVY